MPDRLRVDDSRGLIYEVNSAAVQFRRVRTAIQGGDHAFGTEAPANDQQH